MLEALGVRGEDEAVYRELLTRTQAGVGELADALGVVASTRVPELLLKFATLVAPGSMMDQLAPTRRMDET